MDIDIKELIKTAAGNLDLKDFKGDVVAVKYVENEFGTIENGGIAIQNNYYGTAKKADGRDVATILDEPLENLIFNARIFNTEDKKMRLRDVIGARIRGAMPSDGSTRQIDPSAKNQWYYVFKAVTARIGDLREGNDRNEFIVLPKNGKAEASSFVCQMMAWYPEVFGELADESAKKSFAVKMCRSISAEKSKWMKGDDEVPVRDMLAACQSLNLDYKKVQPMYIICKELSQALLSLRCSIEQEAAKGC